MEWVIRKGNTAAGVGYTLGLLIGRLEYIAAGKARSPDRLIEEALEFARSLQHWVRENEPPPPPRTIERDTSGKPGPMSDG